MAEQSTLLGNVFSINPKKSISANSIERLQNF